MMAGAGGAMRATGWRATAIRFQQFGEGARVYHILTHSRARGADDGGRRRRDRELRGGARQPSGFNNSVRGDRVHHIFSPTRAREALMMAGAGGAMRATGWRATAIRFQQFGEGGHAFTLLLTHSRARGADDGGRRRRDASYGVARDSHPVSTIR